MNGSLNKLGQGSDALDALSHMAPARARAALAQISAETGVAIEDIMGHSRVPRICRARKAAICAVRIETRWSSTRLGEFFHRHHATILFVLGHLSRVRPRRAAILRDARGRYKSAVRQ